MLTAWSNARSTPHAQPTTLLELQAAIVAQLRGVTNSTGRAMRPEPRMAATHVEASSRWYRHPLGVHRAHVGREHERLVADGTLILQLHRFDIEHHPRCT